jgi:hypothetical protein
MTNAIEQLAVQLADHLLVNGGRRRGDEITGACPFHEERHPSFRFNVNKGAFVCFACGARGGVNKLAEALGIRGHVGPRRRRAPMRRIQEILGDLRAAQTERDRRRGVYEQIGVGSTNPRFAFAVTDYAIAAVWCDNLESELKQAQASAERRRAA